MATDRRPKGVPRLQPLGVAPRVRELRRRGMGLRAITAALARVATSREVRREWQRLQ